MIKKITKPAKVVKKDLNTEEKIISAARKLFTQHGFVATKTRDIAKEAGINLALLNYYFRSKEKLFDIIMAENMINFIQSIGVVINDKNSSLEDKIYAITNNYIDLLIKQPDLPLFVLSELSRHPDKFIQKLKVNEVLSQSYLIKQYNGAVLSGKIKDVHPIHFIANILGLTVFPFVGAPMLKNISGFSNDAYIELMLERKNMIPAWMKSILIADVI
jgi:AcrR family transcriptional regulator